MVMPNVLKHNSAYEYSLVTTANPLMTFVSDDTCSVVFNAVYLRQTQANLLSICIVPLNRFVHVVWKQKRFSGKAWVLIVVGILLRVALVITELLELVVHVFRLDYANSNSLCSLSANFVQIGDWISTLSLLSYPVFCVIKLLLFVRSSQSSIRGSVSQQVIQRQRSILLAIIIQSLAPLLTYLPLFSLTLIVDSPSMEKPGRGWATMNIVHYAMSWSPTIDAVATICCLKSYRLAQSDEHQKFVSAAPS
ncbi:unnamed protein product, partial [Mesorhabditis spiculigera]